MRRRQQARPSHDQAVRSFLETLEERRLLSLLGVSPSDPDTFFNGGTVTYTYNSSNNTGQLVVTATPRNETFTPSQVNPALIGNATLPTAHVREVLLTLNINVADNSVIPTGSLLQVYGDVTDPNTATVYNGLLLQGDPTAFGFQDNDPSTADSFDFIANLDATPGLFAPLFAGNNIFMTLTSTSSTFSGAFNSSFTGIPNGDIGPGTPLPSPAITTSVLLTGLAAAHLANKFRQTKKAAQTVSSKSE